jgi:hypothetical protein
MAEQRVSIFVCHKVATHKRAAARIKEILESRTDRIDVHICEEVLAGTDWRKWIDEQIPKSHILLVLVPGDAADLTWIAAEIGSFKAACPGGRLVALKHACAKVPDIIRDHQVVDASRDELQSRFLTPLYRNSEFAGVDAPLNSRVKDTELERDAQMIEDALLGIVDPRSEFFGESLIVETTGLNLKKPEELDRAIVRAPSACLRILDWNCRTFSWSELRARAEQQRGKGTFWITEMEEVIGDVARQSKARVMTSTFRARGKDTAGQIYRPQLDRVDFVGDTPVRYHFVFHEVLVPELVRGPEHIGEVFTLLYLATRVRWEVLHPFFVKLARDTPPSRWELTQEERRDLVARVSRSLRIIEHQAERHKILEAAENAFADRDRERILRLIKQRKLIKNAIETAANREDFDQFFEGLRRALSLNCEVTELLANRFLQLSHEDRVRTEELLHSIPAAEPAPDETDAGADLIDATWSTYVDTLTPSPGVPDRKLPLQ